jgi:hypothetical protein
MKFHLAFLFCLIILGHISYAQNMDYGKITLSDIALKKTTIDSNANAVVIKEFGESGLRVKSLEFNEGAGGKLYVHFDYQVKIKIFNKNGLKSGDVAIPRKLYRDGSEDEVIEIVGTTYNYVNGELQRSELDKKSITDENIDKSNAVTKFTLPNLKEGSIIEYHYRMNIPYLFNFKGWDFQSDIPKLHSRYVAYIPSIYNYHASLKGHKKLDSTKAEVFSDCIRIFGKTYDCSRLTYMMKNVSAFVKEEHMTAAENFRSAIHYELSDYFDQITIGKKILSQTWKDVDRELAAADYFGGQMKQAALFERLLPGILNGITDSLGKANAVYDYIRKTIKPNGFNGISGDNNVKKALREHLGSSGEINLALIAGLKAAGLDVEALILSTRSNGALTTLYPVLSEFNYVVAKVNIGENSYLLDASQPFLPFGLLPHQCMNGKGRVINLKKASYWFPVKASQRESTTYQLDAELTDDGNMKGKLTIFSNGYAALEKREQIAGAASLDAYVAQVRKSMPKLDIVKYKVINIDSLDNSLQEEYEIMVKALDNTSGQTFFNPFLAHSVNKNPYHLNERAYPVDLGSAKEVRTSVRIKLPEKFEMAEHPKDLSVVLADNGGRYIFKTSSEKDAFSFNEVLQLNKAVYPPEDYVALKEFYSRIIDLQKTNVVIKKTM